MIFGIFLDLKMIQFTSSTRWFARSIVEYELVFCIISFYYKHKILEHSLQINYKVIFVYGRLPITD